MRQTISDSEEMISTDEAAQLAEQQSTPINVYIQCANCEAAINKPTTITVNANMVDDIYRSGICVPDENRCLCGSDMFDVKSMQYDGKSVYLLPPPSVENEKENPNDRLWRWSGNLANLVRLGTFVWWVCTWLLPVLSR